ncbi:hypothetical protein EVAR_55868_1 [Eumeta japonica]|uniref:Uncharacterized protein n=1 Tax=Eumeta variegata TaxID=151549 RepID=A0A4C1Z4C6_EUMVA|nr:hypothetical protein EVAR_55868_1 [Eumeta japonica]
MTLARIETYGSDTPSRAALAVSSRPFAVVRMFLYSPANRAGSRTRNPAAAGLKNDAGSWNTEISVLRDWKPYFKLEATRFECQIDLNLFALCVADILTALVTIVI